MAGVWFCKIGMERLVLMILVIFVSKVQEKWRHIHYPLRSMHGLFTYIYQKNQPNVGKYMDISYVGVASPKSPYPQNEQLLSKVVLLIFLVLPCH